MTCKDLIEQYVKLLQSSCDVGIETGFSTIEIRQVTHLKYVGIGLYIDNKEVWSAIVDEEKNRNNSDYVYYKMIEHVFINGALYLSKKAGMIPRFPCHIKE